MAVDKQKATFVKGLLKEKSEKQGVPLEEVLKNYVYNSIAKRLKAEDINKKYLLINHKALIFSKTKTPEYLSYAYIGDVAEDRKKISNDLKHYLQWDNDGEIRFIFTIEPKSDALEAVIDAALDDFEISIKMRIVTASYMQKTGEERIINGEPFMCYPTEACLAEYGVSIIERLELIESMAVYEDIYSLLGEADLAGRSMTKALLERAEDAGLELDERRIKRLRKYEDSSYMKKRWNAYIKKRNSKDIVYPDWKTVSTLCNDFYEPLWMACCTESVYLDDWMPVIGRWL